MSLNYIVVTQIRSSVAGAKVWSHQALKKLRRLSGVENVEISLSEVHSFRQYFMKNANSMNWMWYKCWKHVWKLIRCTAEKNDKRLRTTFLSKWTWIKNVSCSPLYVFLEINYMQQVIIFDQRHTGVKYWHKSSCEAMDKYLHQYNTQWQKRAWVYMCAFTPMKIVLLQRDMSVFHTTDIPAVLQ